MSLEKDYIERPDLPADTHITTVREHVQALDSVSGLPEMTFLDDDANSVGYYPCEWPDGAPAVTKIFLPLSMIRHRREYYEKRGWGANPEACMNMAIVDAALEALIIHRQIKADQADFIHQVIFPEPT